MECFKSGVVCGLLGTAMMGASMAGASILLADRPPKYSPVEDGGGTKSGSLESPHARVSICCPAGARTDTQQAIVDCISRGMIQHQQCDCQHAHDCSQKMPVKHFNVMETKRQKWGAKD